MATLCRSSATALDWQLSMKHRDEPWLITEVRDQVGHVLGESAAGTVDVLLAWAREQPGVSVTGGSGPSHATLRWEVDTGRGEPIRVLLLYAYPTSQQQSLLEIDLLALRSVPPYDRKHARTGLRADLTSLAIPRLDNSALDMKRPNLYLNQLTNDQAQGLLGVIQEWIGTARASAADVGTAHAQT